MKRRNIAFAAAVILIAVFFCTLFAPFGRDMPEDALISEGFGADGLASTGEKPAAFSDTYNRITGKILSPDCLLTDAQRSFSMRAVWFSYTDWQEQLFSKDEKSFAAQADAVLTRCASLGLNTVILQLRAFGDAFYPSEVYPQSRYAAASGFDAVAVLIKRAKAYGIKVEGWVNPFRLEYEDRMKTLSNETKLGALYRTKDAPMQAAENGMVWLDPASGEAVSLIMAGLKELSRYGFETVWFDDYFYSGVSPKEFGYGKALAKQALDRFVKEAKAVLQAQGMRLGISPQGNIDAALTPASDGKLYTSLIGWCKKGWVDRLMPQVYFGFAHETADFETVTARWEKAVKGTDVELSTALAAYKRGKEDPFAGSGREEWIKQEDVLQRQVEALAGRQEGYALFRYGSLLAQ